MFRPARSLVGAAAALITLLATAPVAAQPSGSAPAPTVAPTATAPTATAPRPTSTAASPEAPDPAPPLGGLGPDGRPVGGADMRVRDVVVPTGAPALPAGLTAAGWVLSDLDTGDVLAARDAHGRYQPASILKALTSLTLLPVLPGTQLVTASPAAANTEGSAVGLVAGGTYSVDTLFQALLLMSGNDAATALAEAAGGVDKTVALMNAKAQALGAYDTVVQTPSGLDGWDQLTSAYDLSLILRAVVDDQRFVDYDRTLTAQLPAEQVGAKAWGPVPLANQSENFLTGVPGALIAKTGFTDAAQHTYMCAAERNGHRLGVVFLRAQRVPTDQWQQAATLLDWGFALPATTRPVGTLVGPSRAPDSAAPDSEAPAHTAHPTATDPGPQRVAAAGLNHAGPTHHGGIPWAVLTSILVVLVVGAATFQIRRSVVRRRAR